MDKGPIASNAFGFSQLPRFNKRSFVPENADLTDLDTVVDLYEKLEAKTCADAGKFGKSLNSENLRNISGKVISRIVIAMRR